jgi:hypothetical protein
MVKTTAELVSDSARVHELALEVMVRNTPGVDREVLSQAAEHMALKRTAVVSKIENPVTWDHTKLGGSY